MEMRDAVQRVWTQACERIGRMDNLQAFIRAVPDVVAHRPARDPNEMYPESLRMLVERHLGDYPASKDATLAALSLMMSWVTEQREKEYLAAVLGLSQQELELWIATAIVAAGGPPFVLGRGPAAPDGSQASADMMAQQLRQMHDQVHHLARMVEAITHQRMGEPPEGPGGQAYFVGLRSFDAMHYTDVRGLLELLPAVGGFAPFKDGFTAKVYNSFNSGYLNFEAQSLLGTLLMQLGAIVPEQRPTDQSVGALEWNAHMLYCLATMSYPTTRDIGSKMASQLRTQLQGALPERLRVMKTEAERAVLAERGYPARINPGRAGTYYNSIPGAVGGAGGGVRPNFNARGGRGGGRFTPNTSPIDRMMRATVQYHDSAWNRGGGEVRHKVTQGNRGNYLMQVRRGGVDSGRQGGARDQKQTGHVREVVLGVYGRTEGTATVRVGRGVSSVPNKNGKCAVISRDHIDNLLQHFAGGTGQARVQCRDQSVAITQAMEKGTGAFGSHHASTEEGTGAVAAKSEPGAEQQATGTTEREGLCEASKGRGVQAHRSSTHRRGRGDRGHYSYPHLGCAQVSAMGYKGDSAERRGHERHKRMDGTWQGGAGSQSECAKGTRDCEGVLGAARSEGVEVRSSEGGHIGRGPGGGDQEAGSCQPRQCKELHEGVKAEASGLGALYRLPMNGEYVSNLCKPPRVPRKVGLVLDVASKIAGKAFDWQALVKMADGRLDVADEFVQHSERFRVGGVKENFFPPSPWMSVQGYREQLQQMEDKGILQRIRKGREGLKQGVVSFVIEKSDGAGRLILDCRVLNAQMQKPPAMMMKGVREVVSSMWGCRYALVFDYKSWFYQFPVGTHLQQCLALHGQGTSDRYRFTRLAMGLSWAPYIAQTASECILGAAGVTGIMWIDNGLCPTVTEGEVVVAKAKLEALWARLGVEIKVCRQHGPGEVFEYVGIEFLLPKSESSVVQYRVSAAFVQQLRALQAFQKGATTPRNLWVLAGSGLWLGLVLGIPLSLFSWLVQRLRPLARWLHKTGKWDERVDGFEQYHEDLAQWMKEIQVDEWRDVPKFHEDEWAASVVSDASDEMGAWMGLWSTEFGWQASGDQWFWRQGDRLNVHIFFKELGAAVQGLQTVLDAAGPSYVKRHGWRLFTDNTAVASCVKHMYSKVEFGNRLLTPLAKVISDGNLPIPRVQWVPSAENLVDQYTRGTRIPMGRGCVVPAGDELLQWNRSHANLGLMRG